MIRLGESNGRFPIHRHFGGSKASRVPIFFEETRGANRVVLLEK